MTTAYKLREIVPFKNAEEILQCIGTPKSRWQEGCNDAKAGLLPKLDIAYVNSYTNGYAYGKQIMEEEKMSKLQDLQYSISDAEDKLQEAVEEMTDFLAPYIKAAYNLNKLPGHYHSLYVSRGVAYIVLRWEGSGGPYDYNYTLPVKVFEQDPETAGKALRDAKKAEDAAAQLVADQVLFEALGKKLGRL